VFKAKEFDRLDIHWEMTLKDDRYKLLENEMNKIRWEAESLRQEWESLRVDLDRKEKSLGEV